MRPVYPRWRGEHRGKKINDPRDIGLSPLARGTPRHQPQTANQRRFIPAGAGNTIPTIITLGSISVYPRWRGEHSKAGRTNGAAAGLSPLARGTQRRIRGVKSLLRFIPAGAGNTEALAKLPDIATVYPRWRGEHLIPCTGPHQISGLSPLARGTPQELKKVRKK